MNCTGPAIAVLSYNNLKFKLLSKMTLGGVQVKAESFTTDAETFGIPSNSQKNESSIDRLAVPLDDSEASAMNG